jgi:diadenosine tetraphosphate (Ap4A) HIT family hydrolase
VFLKQGLWAESIPGSKVKRMDPCIFCNKDKEDIICENELAKAFYDGFPVNHGHILVVPKRHVETYFEAGKEELAAIHDLIFRVREILHRKYKPDGFNIGVNVGTAGGQTVFHLHFHVIPRYLGDVKNPRGGIRKLKKNVVAYPLEDSGEQVFGKLVRDRIPEIIRAAGKEALCRVAEEAEYRDLLRKKLQEETYNYLSTGNAHEIADIVEVLKAILAVEGISWEQLDQQMAEKAATRGGFLNRTVLERVFEAGER